MKHIVTCRICKESFDAKAEEKDIVWIMPSKNYYYHKSCYKNWKTADGLGTKKEDEAWIHYIWDFLARDLKVEYDYVKCNSQRQNFIKKYGYTNKGIFFALKYFYEVQHNKWEGSKNGIGIVPFIYKESCFYWEQQYKKQDRVLIDIEKQMRERRERESITVTKKKKATRWKSQLQQIGELEDE